MRMREERARTLKKTGNSVCLLRTEHVHVDLGTDNRTYPLSDHRWAGMMLGDEAKAGGKNFYNLEARAQYFYRANQLVPLLIIDLVVKEASRS